MSTISDQIEKEDMPTLNLDVTTRSPRHPLSRPYRHSCPLATCNSSFKNSAELRRHMKAHLHEKYQCDSCGYSTTRSDKMKFHRSRHHQESTTQDLSTGLDTISPLVSFSDQVSTKRQTPRALTDIVPEDGNQYTPRIPHTPEKDVFSGKELPKLTDKSQKLSIDGTLQYLDKWEQTLLDLQAHIRGNQIRNQLLYTMRFLRNHEQSVINFQSQARGYILRMVALGKEYTSEKYSFTPSMRTFPNSRTHQEGNNDQHPLDSVPTRIRSEMDTKPGIGAPLSSSGGLQMNPHTSIEAIDKRSMNQEAHIPGTADQNVAFFTTIEDISEITRSLNTFKDCDTARINNAEYSDNYARATSTVNIGSRSVLDNTSSLHDSDNNIHLHASKERHILRDFRILQDGDWEHVQSQLPEPWKWDIVFEGECWTYAPADPNEFHYIPLTIAGKPVVVPVDHRWPPMAGNAPPPDPRPTLPIDCSKELPVDIIRDLYITYEGCIGFYVLINRLLQIIVPKVFDIVWAASHLPHKYGGLKVCYISQSIHPTSSNNTHTMDSISHSQNGSSVFSRVFHRPKSPNVPISQPLSVNDSIEARLKSSFTTDRIFKRDRFAGRIGLRVQKEDKSYLLMSTHVINRAISSRSFLDFSPWRGHRPEKLEDKWNAKVETRAGGKPIGSINRIFDPNAGEYPDGFQHDITLIEPIDSSTIASVKSPVADIGWLRRDSWASLRHQSVPVKLLHREPESPRQQEAKTIRCYLPSEILMVGEGIFLNQNEAPGFYKGTSNRATWESLVSRAVLYRVSPDFESPLGNSGVALCAENSTRHDGTTGVGIAGFQSFVQMSNSAQNYRVDGAPFMSRLRLGRVSFYGAFPVPEELKEYRIA